MTDIEESVAKSRKLVHELDRADLQRWQQYGVTSWQWYLLLIFMLLPWVIWAKLADRRRLLELLLVGTLVMLVTMLLDVLGYNLHFWDYPIEILPLGVPGALPFDLSMVPVAYMLLYQYCGAWRSYLLGLLVMACLYAFIGEPLCHWLKFVIYFKWNPLYSFLYYIVIGISVRAFVRRLAGLYRPQTHR